MNRRRLNGTALSAKAEDERSTGLVCWHRICRVSHAMARRYAERKLARFPTTKEARLVTQVLTSTDGLVASRHQVSDCARAKRQPRVQFSSV